MKKSQCTANLFRSNPSQVSATFGTWRPEVQILSPRPAHIPRFGGGCAIYRVISPYGEPVDIAQLQDVIERTYGDRDRARGVPSTVAWLAEEIGELAQAVRKGTKAQQEHEFGDVLAWVATLANQMGVDLSACVERYANGCPRCAALPCAC